MNVHHVNLSILVIKHFEQSGIKAAGLKLKQTLPS